MELPSAPDAGRVMLLHSEPGLEAWLGHALPDARIVAQSFELGAWLRTAFDPQVIGVVLDTEVLPLSDLRTVLASLQRDPRPWLLALCGDRGLAGCENLLSAPRTVVLPKPWTPDGVEFALQLLRGAGAAAPPAAGASDAFLTGLVEGLRDPLSSLGGYLQLLQHHASNGSTELLRPAMDSARALERQIECLYLASAPIRPRTERLDLRPLAAEALQEARREDARVEADFPEGELAADADPRYVRAALGIGRLLLERFGPGGPVRLQATRDADGLRLSWEAPHSASTAASRGDVAPPSFLPELLERLAARVPARLVLDRLNGVVPVSAGLRWARDAAVKA
ncbi:MAG: hypothetical protein O3A20_08790 [Planctomycetota bacterium]|nr:hypothetical protein [Planctomycetota bacterium]